MYNMEEKLSAYWKDATTFDTQYYISRTNISSVFETNSGIGLNGYALSLELWFYSYFRGIVSLSQIFRQWNVWRENPVDPFG